MFKTIKTRKEQSKYRKCSVAGCSSNTKSNLDLVFHTFPAPNGRFVYVDDDLGNRNKVDQLTAWKMYLKTKKVMYDMRVCSKHFTKDDYFFPDLPCSQRKLRATAVPTINLPSSNEKITRNNNDRLEKRLKRERNTKRSVNVECSKKSDAVSAVQMVNHHFENLNVNHGINNGNDIIENSFERNTNDCVCNVIESGLKRNEIIEDVEEFEEMDKTDSIPASLMIQEQISDAENLQDKFKDGINISIVKLSSEDFGVQVDTGYKFFKLIKTKEQLSTATGIESFEILHVIIESVKVATDNKFESEKFTMKTEDRVVMTYVKLKQNLSYSFLALIFDCVTPQHCRTIFIETVRVLSKCLKEAIPWPSKEELRKNIPQCFKDFEDTRVVVDCTEVFIQRPKNLCCQILTYSHYKGAQTAKIMTGVTPGGNISFISKPYGGRASDSAIFEQSDLVKLLEPSDGVMVDKGFLIKELCQKNQFRFIQPPFLRNKKQFSKEESIYTAKVAKARVHIERSNQRIKVFKMLGSVLPVSLVPYLQDIFVIICGTVNLSAPIIGDDKFMSDEMNET